MIKIKNLSKSFGEVKAIDDLSLEIKPGEIVGFLGPNGAGKTTTMRLLSGFLYPDSGSITIDNVDLQDNIVESQKQIGYLAENNPLYRDLLVSEILNFSMDLKHLRRDKRKAALDFAVEAVNIQNVYYHPIKELSKGYRQRVGMALALLRRPKILIFDEPTEGLDPNQRQEVRSLIKKLATDRTIIMSTHVMAEASAVCNRIVIVNHGQLVADGSAEELSLLAHAQRVLDVEIEGNRVIESLNTISEAKNLKLNSIGANRFSGQIILSEKENLQPKISSLAAQNNWIIWKISEEETKLEDIFQLLTKK